MKSKFSKMNRLLIAFLFFHDSIINAYDFHRPSCETCLSTQIHDAPGIGFDLTPSYVSKRCSFYSGISNIRQRTASVHYYNGTVVDIAHIQGNREYLELMKRLADEPRSQMDRTNQSLYSIVLTQLSQSDTTSWGT